MEEYKHIQKLRQTWSGFIMDWLRIMIPVCAAFDGLFSYFSLAQARCLSYSWVFPLLGWLIFVIPLITWRVVVHYIDRQIVDLYPRMLELEQQMQPQKEPPMPPPWHTHAIYYFNNLTQGARRLLLEQQLQLSGNDARDLSYRQYAQICSRVGADPHLLLLHVWDEQHGHPSVTSRGHLIQNVSIGIICFVTLSIAGFLSWGIGPDSRGWVPFTIAIGVSAVLAVIFAFIAARWLVNR